MKLENKPNLNDSKSSLEYMKELLTDRMSLSYYPTTFYHVEKILDQEILRVRSSLFSTYGIYTITDADLPEPEGPKIRLHTKVYVPVDSNKSFNFVGRILGPGGTTAKCLQMCLGVKIMVRGRGSMRDRKKEEANIGKPNWEHLNENLHVVLTVEDFENRAKARLAKASSYISLFLSESPKTSDKEDKVKQMQLMELSLRRDPRAMWQYPGNGLLDCSPPNKPEAMYPNYNLMGLSYGYSPASFFPTLNTQPRHQHTPYYGSMPSGPSQGTGQSNGLTQSSFSPSISPGLGQAMIVGPGSYSPTSHGAQTGTQLVNYWPTNGAQYSTDYPYLQLPPPPPNDQPNMSGDQSLITEAPNAMNPVYFVSPNQPFQRMADELQDFHSDAGNIDAQTSMLHPSYPGLFAPLSVSRQQTATPAQIAPQDSNYTKPVGTKHRYSHKHNSQAGPNRSSRVAVVSLRLRNSEEPNNTEVDSIDEKTVPKSLIGKKSNVKNKPQHKLKTRNSTESGHKTSPISTDESEWPKLGSPGCTSKDSDRSRSSITSSELSRSLLALSFGLNSDEPDNNETANAILDKSDVSSSRTSLGC